MSSVEQTAERISMYVVETEGISEEALKRTGIAVYAYYKTIRQRGYLVIVTNARHRRTCWYKIAKMVEQTKHFVLAHRVAILVFDAGYIAGYAVMHVGR